MAFDPIPRLLVSIGGGGGSGSLEAYPYKSFRT